MTKLLSNASRWLFRGVRTRNAALTAVGAALAAVSWVRSSTRGRELLWAKNLRPGDAFRIRLVGDDGEVEADIEVDG